VKPAVAKDKKSKTAIYHPPKSGVPYLVVTVSPDGVVATAVETKEEARILASKKTLKVSLQDASTES
jgi:hypothetical protein